jgi:prepilin-type processing-associated H-X9-DG protein
MPTSRHTNIVAITGPGTAFDEDRECTLDDIDVDTIVAIELQDSGIDWAAPGDLPISEITASVLSGLDGHGVNVLFADGTVWYIPHEVRFEDLKKFFTIEGARQFDRERTLKTPVIMHGKIATGRATSPR